jgi:hypothetical protein
MRFQVQHTTAYTYEAPVRLGHWFEEPTEMLRLRSRFTLHTEPAAAGARCPQPPGWVAATALELCRHFLSCLALRDGYGDPVVATLSEVLRRRAVDPLAFLAALNAHLQETSSGKPARRVGHCCRRRQPCGAAGAPAGIWRCSSPRSAGSRGWQCAS